jgi:aminopeptidase N
MPRHTIVRSPRAFRLAILLTDLCFLASCGPQYFHNWSGNRVTCRDWFQLTLKEGLTVFRDQQFSADMGSAAVKRIEDVRVLRSRQFSEDAGPRAHPIRPESYIKNDNFYTSTVYEKGAEVIRMYHTLLGPEGFRRGMDLYWERHDGSAVTCDDFRAAMADANGADLSQFERWYLQAGTPVLEVSRAYDPAARRFSLTLKQSCAATVGQPSKLPFHVPVRVGLLGRDGREVVPSTVLELKEASQTFHFEGLAEEPVPSVLRGFSAPVRLKMAQSDEELAFLMAHDTDSFNRWDASQQLATKAISAATEALADGKAPPAVAPTMVEAFRAVLRASEDPSVDKSLLAYALSLPDEMTLLSDMDVMRPLALHGGREHVRASLLAALREDFLRVYRALDVDVPYSVEPAEIGRRRLKNVCLSYLCAAKDAEGEALAMEAFRRATCMTDSLAALSCLASLPGPSKDEALADFYAAAKGDPLVLNKWFTIQATADLPDAVERVAALLKHPDFSLRNPNRVRAVVSAFANANLAHFHAEGGAGYKLVTDAILEVDKINGLVAARLTGSLSLWRKFELQRRNLMKEQLDRLAKTEGLSRDTYEIVQQNLMSAQG